MDQQIDQRLQAIEKKLEDIEQVVVKTRKVQKRAATVRSLYWIFIILLGFGAFYFIQPWIDELKNAYGLGDNTDSQNFNQLLEQLQSTDY